MSEELERTRVSRDGNAELQRKSRGFQTVPGEAEAEAVRDAFLQSAGSDPAQLASGLSRVDPAARGRAVGRLQQERGNAYMQRVAAEARGTPGRLVGRSQPEMMEEVQRRKGTGSPLPEGARQKMEGLFGADLGGVRVHDNTEARELNQELDAEAFTIGSEVFVGEGSYSPDSTRGQALLAHELTHVAQQGGLGAQRQAMPEEEEVQTRAREDVVQRQEEEEELQARAKEEGVQRQEEEEELGAG
jgi:hypothetical protein